MTFDPISIRESYIAIRTFLQEAYSLTDALLLYFAHLKNPEKKNNRRWTIKCWFWTQQYKCSISTENKKSMVIHEEINNMTETLIFAITFIPEQRENSYCT